MCYSFAVPNEKQLNELPVNYERDKDAWVQLRLDQDWEQSASKEEVRCVLGMTGKPRASQLQVGKPGERVYPRYFAPAVARDNGKNLLRPMRYALRPASSPWELASKYCLYNARLDRLLEAKTWKPLVGRHHGILPFTKFFEWVTRASKKTQIQFEPEGKSLMWAPVIWDYWESPRGELAFYSCALITDNPPPEVAAAGHDRCPIFLAADAVPSWLDAGSRPPAEWRAFLTDHREPVHYTHRLAA